MLRAVVVVVFALVFLGCTEKRETAPVYEYRDEQGRSHFVSDRDEIPPKFRATAHAVDLSKVSLNEGLGNGMRDETERRYAEKKEADRKAAERLAADGGAPGLRARDSKSRAADGSDPCAAPPSALEASAAGGAPYWQQAWARYPYLVVVGALIALLLASTPIVLRSVPQKKWLRLLGWACPLLVFLAGIAHASSRFSQGARSLRGLFSGDVCAETAPIGGATPLPSELVK